MNALQYSVAADKILLQENKRDEDIEFIIKFQKAEIQKDLHELRQFFENDAVYSDVLFYTYKDHLQVIVKKESYVSFILGLFKWKLLKNVQWNE
ncbi:hypothetical protein [Heyndrickxia ginsengihumi]|uniref:Uncharacterized protein n=2 Tax=Heyndrickxia ginsengihumi TaxID=363870 RepID=A0A0A6Y1S3_9BACI|nr:hypothetical protein [Heyndrickxia ginsengihumi]KHD86227.1 hypothetical protein NG54_04170 [Heyndrickxia ginsengihumi]MBE6184379.1 hypothetical protein [Bacillus sp. (in: firmicutes)]MCM3024447.1 hypothetical protein [Heyndrickxia ginsengihumi]NEY20255.1 hypothetical protein [Heyndrickxia ginsengihumi]